MRKRLKKNFPIPSLHLQKSIVAGIEADQSPVNANRELIACFEKKIQSTLARVWGEERADVVALSAQDKMIAVKIGVSES